MKEQVEEAIAAVKAGNVDAYEKVVKFYQSRLRGAVASRCPPGLDPDEIAQTAFMDAYSKIGRYKPGTEFYWWLWAFARNTLMAQIRKRKRLLNRQETYVDKMLLAKAEQEMDFEQAADNPHLQALRECLSELSQDALGMLRTRYGENEALKTVAEFAGRTVSAVKVKLFALRRALRECVERKLEPEESSG